MNVVGPTVAALLFWNCLILIDLGGEVVADGADILHRILNNDGDIRGHVQLYSGA